MARKKITADLNGGDAVTAMANLEFQVHDSDNSDAIIATANYAAIGSVNTNGTDGGNIVYTLNPTGGGGGNGQIILDGVDIGTATNIKIRCKDEAGNESLLSPTFGAFLFEETFDGLVIDTVKWAVVNGAPAVFEWTQNDQLIGSYKTTSTQLNWTNNLIANNTIPFADIKAITFDITHDDQNNNDYVIGLTADVVLGDNNNRVGLQKTGTAGKVVTILREAGVTEYTAEETIDLSTTKTFKITFLAGTVSFYYWGGASWTLLGSNVVTLAGNATPFIDARQISLGGTGTTLNIDNFVVTGADFSTLRP